MVLLTPLSLSRLSRQADAASKHAAMAAFNNAGHFDNEPKLGHGPDKTQGAPSEAAQAPLCSKEVAQLARPQAAATATSKVLLCHHFAACAHLLCKHSSHFFRVTSAWIENS